MGNIDLQMPIDKLHTKEWINCREERNEAQDTEVEKEDENLWDEGKGRVDNSSLSRLPPPEV